MKYIIVGQHSTGKWEVAELLKELGDRVGTPFSNYTPDPRTYGSEHYIPFDTDTINTLFENRAYIYLQEVALPSCQSQIKRYYEGLDSTTYDENDVFVMTPDQVLNSIRDSFGNDVCWIWMDSNKSIRQNRHRTEKRGYSFRERELIEAPFLGDLSKFLYSTDAPHVIYFDNEVPARIATIIHSLIQHPDLIDLYIKYFN